MPGSEIRPGMDFIELLENPTTNAVAVGLFGKLLEASPAALVFTRFNPEGQPIEIHPNSTAHKLLGETVGTRLNLSDPRRWTRFLHPHDFATYLREEDTQIREGVGTPQRTFRLLSAESRGVAQGPSSYLWISEATATYRDPLTRQTATLAVFQDVTKLGDFAFKDALTGLHNRRFLNERWPSEFERLQKSKGKEPSSVGLTILDLDHLKLVNDQGGHLQGDAAIMTAADFLEKNLRDYDIAIRFGGDEFLVVSPGDNRIRTKGLATRIHSIFRGAYFQFSGVRLTMSVGFCSMNLRGLTTKPAETLNELIRRSDRALYNAKRAGRDCVVGYKQRSTRNTA